MKKTMKKVLSLAMAAAMVLALGACSKSDKTDLEMVKENGKLKIGFTYYEPMNYKDENGDFVGFETEFAQAVSEKLGVEAEFVEISWDAKITELQSKNVDCLWNGMTITPEISEALSTSDPYLKNFQVVVIRNENANEFKTTADLVGKNVAAEAGSAGEATMKGDAPEENLAQAVCLSVGKQTDALMEIKAGGVDAGIMDFVLADAVVGKNDYADLMVIPDLQLSVEEYGVGFRKDSDLVPEVNKAMQEMVEDGSLNTLAEKYGLAGQLVSNEK